MELIQSKLQEVMGQSEMASVAKLSTLLNTDTDSTMSGAAVPAFKVMETDKPKPTIYAAGKSVDKKPIKAKKGKEFTKWKAGCVTPQKKLFLSKRPKSMRRVKNRVAF
jgi:hypothetical protein